MGTYTRPPQQKCPFHAESHHGVKVRCTKILFKDKNTSSEKLLFNYLLPYSFAL